MSRFLWFTVYIITYKIVLQIENIQFMIRNNVCILSFAICKYHASFATDTAKNISVYRSFFHVIICRSYELLNMGHPV